MSRTEFVIVMTMTLIVVLAWVITGIIKVRPSVDVDPRITELLEPIDPTFDQEALKLLKTPPTPLPLFSPAPKKPVAAPSSSPSLLKFTLPSATNSATPAASLPNQ